MEMVKTFKITRSTLDRALKYKETARATICCGKRPSSVAA